MRWCLALLFIVCCAPKDESLVTIIWEDNKAVAISIFESSDSLEVSLRGAPYPVIGEHNTRDGHSVFTPAVPFERGSEYVVTTSSRAMYSFLVPADTTQRAPALTGSFPSCDTVPSNLLKMYLQFSEPMMEGRSSQFVQLFDAVTGDTLNSAFLDLQPELWNEDGTILTLWLDPGRIKQDLIPNKKLGVVLNDSRRYTLKVARGWRSKNGLPIEREFNRTFTASKRDVAKPNFKLWSVSAARTEVRIEFNESLDWSLINSCFSIWSGDQEIEALTIAELCETSLTILPPIVMQPGDYSLNIESRLEDLAGNNLNRLFETDVTNESKVSQKKDVYTISFRVN